MIMGMVAVPRNYDYIAVYLTDRCPLRCSYCITEHNDTRFITGSDAASRLTPQEWANALNRLDLPAGVPLSLQGGEPFVYPGIWELLELLDHDFDILTALPRNAKLENFEKMSPKALKHLNRGAVYPSVRVSYHPGQNKIEDLVERVKALMPLVSIGIYSVAHPNSMSEIARARDLCEKAGVLFKTKEFLGFHEGKLYGQYKYPDASIGKASGQKVLCKNSVLILAPNGTAYRCHSDLYHKRNAFAVGNITDPKFQIKDEFTLCSNYGLCSECDIKVKTNHEQKFGYTSVSIEFLPEPKREHAEISTHA